MPVIAEGMRRIEAGMRRRIPMAGPGAGARRAGRTPHQRPDLEPGRPAAGGRLGSRHQPRGANREADDRAAGEGEIGYGRPRLSGDEPAVLHVRCQDADQGDGAAAREADHGIAAIIGHGVRQAAHHGDAVAIGKGKVADPVGPAIRREDEGVGAGAAQQRVVAEIARQPVVAILAGQQVVVLAAEQRVVTDAAIDEAYDKNLDPFNLLILMDDCVGELRKY